MLIVGGGVAGLFCAYFACRNGWRVAVLERGQVGGPQSCSYGNTGFVGTQGAAPLAAPGVPAQALRWLLNPESPFYIKPRWDPELLSWLRHFRRFCTEQAAAACFTVLLDLKQRSLAILRELCASGDLAATFAAPGIVVAFKTPEAFAAARRSVPGLAANGVPVRVLGPAELRELEPAAELDISGALFNAEGAYLRVPEFITEFARVLRAMGVAIYPGTEVTGFEVTAGRVSGVRTAPRDFRPREVVLAAGTWSAECARKLGVGLELQPAKGYSVTVRAPHNAPRLPVLLSEGKIAVVPLGDRLRFGGTLELSGMDPAVSRRRVAGIVRTVRGYLPRLGPLETVETWSGFRPCTPDSLPFLGRAGPYRNLWVATGHGYVGMGLAPACGKLLAQVMGGQQPDTDIGPLRAGRFGREPG